MSDGQDDLSNSMNDVGLKEKKLEHEKEGKHPLREDKNEKNSERIEEKINLNKVSFGRCSAFGVRHIKIHYVRHNCSDLNIKQLKRNQKKKKLKSSLTLKMFSFKRSKMHSRPSLIQ